MQEFVDITTQPKLAPMRQHDMLHLHREQFVYMNIKRSEYRCSGCYLYELLVDYDVLLQFWPHSIIVWS